MKNLKLVYIVVGDPHFTFENANSAVVLYLKTIAAELQKEGYNVMLFPTSPPQIKTSSGKNHSVLKKVKRLVKFLFKGFYLRRLFGVKRDFSDRLYKNIVSEGHTPSLVIEFLTTGSTIGIKLSKFYAVPFVVIYDSPLAEQFVDMYGYNNRVNFEIELCEEKVLREADTIVCYSQAVSTFISNKILLSPKIEVIPCIVWKENCSDNRSGQDLVIGFIGSFLKWHRVDLLIGAFELLADQNSVVRLVLVGFGEQWEQTKTICQSSRHKNRIQLTGFVDEQKLNELKSTFDIGVMPGSNWYGSPLKIFEYADLGMAVISAKSPTIQELFSGEEILFIDEDNSENSLYGHLKLLTENKDIRDALGVNIKNKMRNNYSKTSVMNNFIKIINKHIDL